MNKKCQVFTPENYVKELLDSVDYTNNLYGKSFLENSCGDGNILTVVVQRYIDDCRRKNIPDIEISIGLHNDIYGVEIDEAQYNKCICNLNDILSKNNIPYIEWNIYNEDYLRWADSINFSFIVGNPPYINYHDIDEENQIFLKENFLSCRKGKFDYCYAFIEKSLHSLSKNGKMAYLVPSSIFKTVFGQNLRELMKPHISIVKDYTQEKVFDNALVKSAIIVLSGERKEDLLKYVDMTNDSSIDIEIERLTDKWLFTNNIPSGDKKFGDYFKVSHTVATLLNEAYVITDYIESENGIICGEHFIEKSLIRDTATPRSLRYGRDEKIIFPYSYTDSLIRYEEDDFLRLFPNGAYFLMQFKDKLDKRKKDAQCRWFEYGRSQALSELNQEKLLISTIITDKIPIYRLSKECIPYAGMYIVPQDNNNLYSLDDALNILNDVKFMNYVQNIGIHISGKSLRITSKDIENYRF